MALRTRTALITATLFLTVFGVRLIARTLPVLQGEFWVEIEPFVRQEGAERESEDDQIRLLLEEARLVFAGMVYGFKFRYVPGDRRREVAEEFDLDLAAEIPWGDPALHVTESRYESGRRYVLITYFVSAEQGPWIRFWESNLHPSATAFGEGNLFRGREEKLNAIREGVKEAVRGYLRTREYNKPREISGLVAFASAPYVIIDAGVYRAKVEVKLDIREIVPYKIY